MEFRCYMPDVSDYKKNLEQFYLDCAALQSNVLSAELQSNALSKRKVSYQPSVNTYIVPYFDSYVNRGDYKNIGKEYNLENLDIPKESFPGAVRDFWLGVKITLMQEIEKAYPPYFSKEGYISFDKWITTKLNEVQIPEKRGNLKDLGEITKRKWINFSNAYAEIHQMRKIHPSAELQTRLDNCRSTCDRQIIDCALYVICSLGLMEDLSGGMKSKLINAEAENFNQALLNVFLEDLGYRFVDEPTADDVIVYLRGSDNEPVHFAKFVNHERVVSKFGEQAIYEHDFKQCCYGDSYVILRKGTVLACGK